MASERLYNNFTLLVTSLVLASGSWAWAWPPTYGAEFEFVSREIIKKWDNLNWDEPEKAQQKFIQVVRENCGGDCQKIINNEVHLKNGLTFKIDFDPGTVEVQTRPSTLDPRPSTLDPRPSTLDPRPSTLDTKRTKKVGAKY